MMVTYEESKQDNTSVTRISELGHEKFVHGAQESKIGAEIV